MLYFEMLFQVSLHHQKFALSSPNEMKYTGIKRGLLIRGNSTSIFQKRIKPFAFISVLELISNLHQISTYFVNKFLVIIIVVLFPCLHLLVI